MNAHLVGRIAASEPAGVVRRTRGARSQVLNVEFARTAVRRYAVRVHRDGATLVMDPAPGYDALMPHDLLHFVVEEGLGLHGAIFGQLARGGNAATFHDRSAADARAVKRRRRREDKRGDALLRTGRDESLLSERATYLCFFEWLRRSPEPAMRARAERMRAEAEHVRRTCDAESLARIDAGLERICARLDALGSAWSALAVGESFVVEWSRDARSRRRS